MTKTILTISIMFFYASILEAEEPVIGGPCQGCELVFVDMPNRLKSHSKITPVDEKGEKLFVKGIVYKMDKTPAVGIIIYAYQTDAEGQYPKGAVAHGNLRGWAITDAKGKYSFETIRPKSYIKSDIPQHIHMHVVEPKKGTYYIDDITFTDDPFLTKEYQNKRPCRGGCGVTSPKKNNLGSWYINRDIFLGKAIPNYK